MYPPQLSSYIPQLVNNTPLYLEEGIDRSHYLSDIMITEDIVNEGCLYGRQPSLRNTKIYPKYVKYPQFACLNHTK